MSRTKRILENLYERFGYHGYHAQFIQEMETQEMEWYFENSERPHVASRDDDEDSSITEQGI